MDHMDYKGNGLRVQLSKKDLRSVREQSHLDHAQPRQPRIRSLPQTTGDPKIGRPSNIWNKEQKNLPVSNPNHRDYPSERYTRNYYDEPRPYPQRSSTQYYQEPQLPQFPMAQPLYQSPYVEQQTYDRYRDAYRINYRNDYRGVHPCSYRNDYRSSYRDSYMDPYRNQHRY